MKKTNRINIDSLREEAKTSEDKEAFQVLAKTQNCRVGVGVRFESEENPFYFIEVLVSLCTSNRSVNLDLVEKNLLLLRQLDKREYVLNCEEDGSISCELAVSFKNLTAECESVLDMCGGNK